LFVLCRLIASTLRQNILRVLYYHNGEISITKIVTETNSTHGEVMRCLRIYEGYAIVRVKRVGRRVYISLNLENEDTKTLLEAIWFLESHEHRRSKNLHTSCPPDSFSVKEELFV